MMAASFYPIIFEYRYNKIIYNLKLFAIVFVISMDKRKDVIANSQGTGTTDIIREWMATGLLVVTIMIIYWLICFIVNNIVLSGINRVYKMKHLKRQLEDIDAMIASQKLKELKGVRKNTSKALENYISELFSYGFREKGPKEKIVIDKRLQMNQDYRITEVDEIDLNSIEVRKVKARKFGHDFTEGLIKKYKEDEKNRDEWFEGEELDADDAKISKGWHGAVGRLFSKSGGSNSLPKPIAVGKNPVVISVGAGGTGNSPKSNSKQGSAGSPKNNTKVSVNSPGILSPKSQKPNP